jgi:hypothetical protein
MIITGLARIHGWSKSSLCFLNSCYSTIDSIFLLLFLCEGERDFLINESFDSLSHASEMTLPHSKKKRKEMTLPHPAIFVSRGWMNCSGLLKRETYQIWKGFAFVHVSVDKSGRCMSVYVGEFVSCGIIQHGLRVINDNDGRVNLRPKRLLLGPVIPSTRSRSRTKTDKLWHKVANNKPES